MGSTSFDGRQAIARTGILAAVAALFFSFSGAFAEEVVFATRPLYKDGHWYANIGYFARDAKEKTYEKGGGLYVVDTATGRVRTLVEDDEGTVRDPAVHYDGKTILFSWRRGDSETFHLFTIQADGSGLAQLTDGEYDDFEPAWLPDGGIVFVSTRCKRWVNCWLTQVAVVHRCDADGGNITPLSANIEHDNTPWPLPDGRILYTRWEYVDRSQVDYHHLWTMNPDGTGQMTHFGNMHPSGLYIDAKPVPGSAEEILFINSPGHGAREHAGHVALVDVKSGADDLSSIRNLTERAEYRDPYPLDHDRFLAARGHRLVLLNRDGREETLFELKRDRRRLELHEPRPLRARDREPVIPKRTDWTRATGRLILSDIRAGRNMDGVAPGEITRLLVVESLPKPINYTGGMDPLTYGGSFTLERVLGSVPVEPDGSANFEVPANRSLFLIALDKDENSVKRMQSFLSVMPGETLSCVGCHEPRSTAALNTGRPKLAALARPASAITPVPGIPEVLDFPRDIQPVLDRHCLPCHDYTAHPRADRGPRAGGVILSGDRGPLYSHSYATLFAHLLVADGRDLAKSNLAPRSIGAAASPLMDKLGGGHYGVEPSPEEVRLVRYWIETGATYPGTYAALGGGSIGGYYANEVVENDAEWPEARAVAAVVDRRCAACHEGLKSLPRGLSDENGLSFWRLDNWEDPRVMRTRHLMYNLSRPELSMMLLAPLSPDAGGYGRCKNADGTPVIAAKDDADWRTILALSEAGKRRLEEIKRFDMPGFVPPAPYTREMKRYGILPPDTDPAQPYDFRAADLAYWNSFVFSPAGK
jgi:hypothetical protein